MTARKLLPTDPDLAGVDVALRRAAKSALKLARQTNTPCYVVKGWKNCGYCRATYEYSAI